MYESFVLISSIVNSLQWTYFPGIEDSTFVALELMNILHGYPRHDEVSYRPTQVCMHLN